MNDSRISCGLYIPVSVIVISLLEAAGKSWNVHVTFQSAGPWGWGEASGDALRSSCHDRGHIPAMCHVVRQLLWMWYQTMTEYLKWRRRWPMLMKSLLESAVHSLLLTACQQSWMMVALNLPLAPWWRFVSNCSQVNNVTSNVSTINKNTNERFCTHYTGHTRSSEVCSSIRTYAGKFPWYNYVLMMYRVWISLVRKGVPCQLVGQYNTPYLHCRYASVIY